MQRTLTGSFHRWALGENKRLFATIVLSYEEARAFFSPVKFNVLTGKGEQRDIAEAHAKKLRNAMDEGKYTPTPISAGIRPEVVSSLKLDDTGGNFSLELSDKLPLPMTDGSHRMEAIKLLLDAASAEYDQAEAEEDEEAMERAGARTEQILNLPISITVYFDGSTQRDFINLQAGKAVDKAHMLSLEISQKLVNEPERKLAFDIARYLAKQPGPLTNLVRFGSGGSAPIPFTTLCSKTKSDLGTSLVGLARIGLAFKETDPAKLGGFVLDAYKALENHPNLIEGGKVLAPIAHGGTKGTSTMLLGVGTLLAYRRLASNDEQEEQLTRLVHAAVETLDEKVSGNLSGPRKRSLMGRFARVYLEGLDKGMHDGLPIELLQTLSTSTFDAESLPRVRKPRKPETVAATETADEAPWDRVA